MMMDEKVKCLTSVFDALQLLAEQRNVSMRTICIEFDFLIERENLALGSIQDIEFTDWKEVCFPLMHSFVDDLTNQPHHDFIYTPKRE